MPVRRRNRAIMGVAIVLGAIFVAVDHSHFRRSLPAPVAGESEGGYGSASDDTDTSVTTGPGAETGGYGAAAGDTDTPRGPETSGYGVASEASPDETGQGAAATSTSDEDVSGDMEEYYKRLQLDAETDNPR